MNKTMNYKGVQLKLAEVLIDLEIGEVLDFTYGDGIPAGAIVRDDIVIIPEGTILYHGENPYNGAEILVDTNGNEITDIAIMDYLDELIKYL